MINRFIRSLACGIAVAALSLSEASAATFDLQTATIEDINKAFDAGALTSEKLVQLYLNRIAAYDKKGPNINAVITLQPKALEHGASARQGTQGKGAAQQAARHSGRAEGSVRYEGHADVGGLSADEEFAAHSTMPPWWRGCVMRARSFLPR